MPGPKPRTKYAKALSKVEEVNRCLDDDIRYSVRYMIDNSMSPCSWHDIEVEPAENQLGVQADSVFIKHDPEKIERLSEEIGKMLGLEVKPDKLYVRVLFTEAKKRYCGLMKDGKFDIVGLEVVRGDWAAVAKNLQEKVLEMILRKQSPEEAAKLVRNFIADLRARRLPYKDLIIWKTLTKRVEDYAVRAPHVMAAKALLKEGWDLSMGDKSVTSSWLDKENSTREQSPTFLLPTTR